MSVKVLAHQLGPKLKVDLAHDLQIKKYYDDDKLFNFVDFFE